MSKKNYYILSEGILKRKENTVYFHNAKGKKPIPINKIYSIYAYGQITFSSQVMSLFAKNGIPIHFLIIMDFIMVHFILVKRYCLAIYLLNKQVFI